MGIERYPRALSAITVALVVAALNIQGQQIAPSAQRQIAALLTEKASRTPAQRKMSSDLVHAAKVFRREPLPPDFPMPPGASTAAQSRANNRFEVDVRGDISPELLEYITNLGGVVTNSVPEYRSVRVNLPLLAVEQLAARPEVAQIRSAEMGYVHQVPSPPGWPVSRKMERNRAIARQLGRFFGSGPRKQSGFGQPFRFPQASFFVGPDFSGDAAHQANVARASFGLDGTGVKIGVVSGGVASLLSEQAAGRLPPVQVIPGQNGGGDEGTAMLEIVYTLAPGATLYFATGQGSQENMAKNIQSLADAGCKIIVDDIGFVSEGVFQDGVLARKVNAVAAAGVFYFSAAGNDGNFQQGTSGVYENDFSSAGTKQLGIDLNLFNGSVVDKILKPSPRGYTLNWSDPLGHSDNDYDLFILDSSLSFVVAASTNAQNGSEDPYEEISDSLHRVIAGDVIVIARKASAAKRALHLNTWGGRLSITTAGSVFGHSAAEGAFTIVAVDVHSAGGGAFTGGTDSTGAPINPLETFNSDGPRRMFFYPDGTAISPGNFLFATNGGTVLNKPDLAAADGVPTGLPNFSPFPGTSAAAPHAAAIAALVLQAKPSLSVSEMRAVLYASAIGRAGNFGAFNSGAGIIMAPGAIAAASSNCTYSLTPGAQVLPAAGGSGSIGITTQSGCPWTFLTSAPWIFRTGTGTGPGSGTASYDAIGNPGTARVGSIFLGDRVFKVEQQAASVFGSNFVGSMPHIAAEENWTTTFALVNKGPASAEARFSMFAEGGAPLQLPLNLPQEQSPAETLLAGSLDRTLQSNESLIITTAEMTTVPVQIGSAQVAANGSIDGFAIFHLIPGAQEAVVPLETRNAPSYVLAFDQTDGVVLGVALANISAQASTVQAIVRDETGTQISSGPLPALAGSGHTSFVLSQQFPATANKRGTIQFVPPAGRQISVLGIRTTPAGSTTTLTTIPALANVGTTGGSIAHLATGNGWQTTFVLVNAGVTAAQAHLKFFADNGSPLSLPIGSPESGGATSVASSIDQNLAAGAMLVVQSTAPPSDPVPTVGSAQLTTNGNIGGFVIFRYNPNGQEAVVPLETRNASAYILAFDNTAGTATGVAINSVSTQPVDIPVVVRDDTGAQIATDTLHLAANGHLAFTLGSDKYPAAANIRGTIEFGKPSGAQVGALGIRIPLAHTFTTVPALAK